MQEKEIFMKEALKEAKKAYDKLEIPVGAIIVKDGKIIARAQIAYAEPNKCLIQIFDEQMWCDNKYIVKKL